MIEPTTQNRTSRGKGAIGPNALVPRYVRDNFSPDLAILDFGAGKQALHAQGLRDAEFWDVTAYENGANFDAEYHDENALIRSYDVVYASNVLNVQGWWTEIVMLVLALWRATRPSGTLVVNLPLSPRKGAWSHSLASRGDKGTTEKVTDLSALRGLLGAFYEDVVIVAGSMYAPAFRCSGRIQPGEDGF